MADYPPEITAGEGARLTEVTKDWALAHGLTVRPPPAVIAADADPHSILATAVPVTLFPSPFPKVCFEQGIAVQTAYNELYASISQDEEFLAQIVQEYVPKITSTDTVYRYAVMESDIWLLHAD